jgi:glucokinase
MLGVGIGSPGFVDPSGIVLGGAENLPGWKGTHVFAPIAERFGLRATAANDVTAAALAEYRFGAGRGVQNMVCLALGTGIGGGIVANGGLYKGSHGMAAELGHIVVETNGLPCNCGQCGCVEQYASATGIVNMARRFAEMNDNKTAFVEAVRKNPEATTAKMVYEAVKAGDPVAHLVHTTAMDMLARVCGIMCNTLSPDRIVLGGGVVMAGQIIVDEVTKHLHKYCWEAIAQRCEIVRAQCGEDAGVLGAAAMVFEDIQ